MSVPSTKRPGISRYLRHIDLPGFGLEGQDQLAASTILMVGLGGLGSPCLQYLAGAGIGRLILLDDDRVEPSNLQRQTIYRPDQTGMAKAEAAAAFVRALNPEIAVEAASLRLDAGNAADWVARADLVIDGTDGLPVRYALNRACIAARVPLVTAALDRLAGQITVLKGYQPEHPCLQCLFPEDPTAPPPESCPDAGILGPVAGLVGCWQASAALMELVGMDHGLTGQLLLIEAQGGTTRRFAVPADPDCPVCAKGSRPPMSQG